MPKWSDSASDPDLHPEDFISEHFFAGPPDMDCSKEAAQMRIRLEFNFYFLYFSFKIRHINWFQAGGPADTVLFCGEPLGGGSGQVNIPGYIYNTFTNSIHKKAP